MMPPEAMAGMPPGYSATDPATGNAPLPADDVGGWGDGVAAGGGALDGLATVDTSIPPGGDPMGDALGGQPDPLGGADPTGGAPAFDGAMAAMDGAAAANMAEGMEVANAAAEADAAAAADAPADDSPTDDVV